MNRIMRWVRTAAAAIALVGAVLVTGQSAFAADKIHLKDGRVLEGTIVRQEKDFIFFKIKVGGIESEQLFSMDQILKIEKEKDEAAGDADAPKKTDDAKAETGTAPNAAEPERKSGATRVAVLNFGPPSSWQGSVGNMVGAIITAKSFREAVPMLEKDKVDVVVVRINSGGGALSELEPFARVFEEQYKKKFRTVGWVESAISAAAMSPWVIEDFYFLPNGNMGACTGWSGDLQAMKGVGLEMVIAWMEELSAKANRSPFIMRSMQIPDPLSVDVDENGNVTWRQDEDGQYVVNPRGKILTFTAGDAVKYKFAKGVASTLDELMAQMKITEWELAGKKATEHIDQSMRDADKAEKRFTETLEKYLQALNFARQQQDRQRRGEFVGRARRNLQEAERLYDDNPLYAQRNVGVDKDWFREQERILRDLMQP